MVAATAGHKPVRGIEGFVLVSPPLKQLAVVMHRTAPDRFVIDQWFARWQVQKAL